MSNLVTSLKRYFQKEWFLSLLLLGIYLLTNRYIYGWDDQHLEIPLLKHLIDPSLYQDDYYVGSLVKNFTSYLYPLLAKCISVNQVPAAYLVLFLISRYFLFYWWLKLWQLLYVRYTQDSAQKFNARLVAVCCVVGAIVLGRTEEFLYRTFSHQEFALAIIFAAVYFFFKERFILAAFIFGVAANVHALYALFPMCYMSFYLLIIHSKDRIKNFVATGLVFVLAASPFLLWAIPKAVVSRAMVDPHMFDNWIELYRLACPQNFPFQEIPFEMVIADYPLLITKCAPFIFVGVLFLFNCIVSEQFRNDGKIRAISIVSVLFIAACFYFSYAQPNRFINDLNLVRNEQYLRFFLIGYLALICAQVFEQKSLMISFVVAFVWIAIGLNSLLTSIIICIAGVLLGAVKLYDREKRSWNWLIGFMMGMLLVIVAAIFKAVDFKSFQIQKSSSFVIMFALTLGTFVVSWFLEKKSYFKLGRTFLLIIPLVVMIGHYCLLHYRYVQMTTRGAGFWQLQRNWEDMQRYVRDHTPKEAVIFTPYNMEMGGFRIQSERKVLVCYRDCGIVGFDYAAALEWQRRVSDVAEFKVFTDPKSITRPIINALFNYKVDYIVFMRYYAPGDNAMVEKIYENEIFVLYQVKANRN